MAKNENQSVPRLREAYAEYFPVGVAVGADVLKRHGLLIAEQFASLTAENCMKPETLQPKEGQFDFREADILVDFAQKHGLKMRGHCLVWHQQTPDWVFLDRHDPGKAAGRELLLERMHRHIQTVLEHFKGSVYCWDVVNEAVADKEAGLLRNSPWLRGVGTDWVAQAFLFARAADPKALLFYNDYNETEQPKLGKINGFLERLLADSVPIDGIGLQAHMGPVWPPKVEIVAALDLYRKLGLTMHVTELDVSVYRWNHGPSPIQEMTEAMRESQIARYDELFTIFRQYKSDIGSVTLWGLSDDKSWLNHFPERNRPNWPLLFGKGGEPKPALFKITSFQNQDLL